MQQTLSKAWTVLRDQGPRRLFHKAKRTVAVYCLPALLRWTVGADKDGTPADDYHGNFAEFIRQVNQIPQASILEVGARNVSGNLARQHFTSHTDYVGFDVHPGPNVDVVGDAHDMAELFAKSSFDAVFSISVFEHLAMPWKALLEINRIMKVGGLLFIATHPTWPGHELPADYWRFSKEAFRVLLNDQTGFRILHCGEGLACSIVPHQRGSATAGLPNEAAYLGVSVVAKKVGAPAANLVWDLDVSTTISGGYPLRSATVATESKAASS